MRPNPSRMSLALCLIPASAIAQSLQPSVPAPIVQSVGTAQAVLSSGTLPSGALPNVGAAAIGQPGAAARLAWHAEQSAAGLYFHVDWSADLATPTLGASLQSQGILLALSAPTVGAALLELEGENFGFVGIVPTLAIDVDDDGLVEFDASVPTRTVPILLGPTPTLVRLRIAANHVGSGSSSLTLQCRPNGAATVSQWNVGCDAVPFAISPTFDGNFLAGSLPIAGQMTIGVLSLRLQSVLLGQHQGLPCLLLPAADVVLPISGIAPQAIVVPPALRPLVFFGQGVGLGANGVVAGNAFAAQAR